MHYIFAAYLVERKNKLIIDLSRLLLALLVKSTLPTGESKIIKIIKFIYDCFIFYKTIKKRKII